MRKRLRIMDSMKRLNSELRGKVLHSLMEGMSIRATARLFGVSKTTILKLIEDAGQAAAWYQDRVLRNLPCTRIQADEIWGFVAVKEAKRLTAKKNYSDQHGDVWVWICTCADTKLVPSFFVGKRDTHASLGLMFDLSERLDGRKFQLTTDAFNRYLPAVGSAFDPENIDYAILQKQYGQSYEGTKGSAERRYSPAICTGAKKVPITGNPDPKHISTSYSERNNLNVRMRSRRMTRLTNAFSKKLENHYYAMSLHFLYYNFVRVHQTLKMTPAMAAGVSKRLWEMKDVVEMLEAWEVVQTHLSPNVRSQSWQS
jgi:IS1 family transposase